MGGFAEFGLCACTLSARSDVTLFKHVALLSFCNERIDSAV